MIGVWWVLPNREKEIRKKKKEKERKKNSSLMY